MNKSLAIFWLCSVLSTAGWTQQDIPRTTCTPPTPATMDLRVYPGSGKAACNWKILPVTSSPTEDCPSVTRWASYSAGPMLDTIRAYQRLLERIDCTTGAVTQSLFSDSTFVPLPSSQIVFEINGQGFNFLPINDSTGWFYKNVQIGDCFKFTLGIENACGSAFDYAYFIVDTFEAPATVTALADAGPAVRLLQNPVSDDVATFRVSLPKQDWIQFVLLDATGRRVRKGRNRFAAGNSLLPMNLDGLAPGLYFYIFDCREISFTGRFVKQ